MAHVPVDSVGASSESCSVRTPGLPFLFLNLGMFGPRAVKLWGRGVVGLCGCAAATASTAPFSQTLKGVCNNFGSQSSRVCARVPCVFIQRTRASREQLDRCHSQQHHRVHVHEVSTAQRVVVLGSSVGHG